MAPFTAVLTVWLVDDDHALLAALARTLRQLLSTDGIVLTFASPLQALQALTNPDIVKPDLLISDFRMPEMTGLDFITRAWAQLSDRTYVVLSSGGHELEARQAIRDKLVHAFLPKPIPEGALERMLARVSEQRSKKLSRTSTTTS